MILSRRFESVRYALKPDFNDFVASVATGLLDEDDLHNDFTINKEYRTENYHLGWASKLLSFGSDLGALADTFKNGPHFYKEVFEHCKTDLEYNIMLRTTDNKLIALSEINAVI